MSNKSGSSDEKDTNESVTIGSDQERESNIAPSTPSIVNPNQIHLTSGNSQPPNRHVSLPIVSGLRRESLTSRTMRENFNHIVEEVRPFFDLGRSSILTRQMSLNTAMDRSVDYQSTANTLAQQNNITQPSAGTSLATGNSNNNEQITSRNNQDVSIDMENSNDNVTVPSSSNNGAGNSSENSDNLNNNETGNNNNNDDTAGEALRQLMPEVRVFLDTMVKYIPFVLILAGKAMYDHREGILNLMALFITFSHTNSILKREVGKQIRRSIVSLLVILFYIFVCVFFVEFLFNAEERLYMNLIFMSQNVPPPTTVWKLLWTVAVNDFIFKLLTIAFKIFITLVPPCILPYQKRGKFYFFVEAISQLYRSLLPIQSWLRFILDSYQGAERVMGVLLAASYMIAKGGDLGVRLKTVKTAFCKVLENVSIGSVATKEQLQAAGETCSICHDSFTAPVALQPCQHVFCEACVCAWLDREPTCPLCRAQVADDPKWRDGSTTYFIQLY